jgi:hypothetical protein
MCVPNFTFPNVPSPIGFPELLLENKIIRYTNIRKMEIHL